MDAEATPTRRFTLLDAMILTGLIALALMPFKSADFSIYFSAEAWRDGWAFLLGDILMTVVPSSLIILSPGALFLRLLPPRPGRQILMTQPGMVASFATSMVIGVILFIDLFISNHLSLSERLLEFFHIENIMVIQVMVHSIPLSIASGWMTLAIGGRWQTDRSWIDRFGIGLGVAWIGTISSGVCHSILIQSGFWS
jgi:hypothetical protein